MKSSLQQNIRLSLAMIISTLMAFNTTAQLSGTYTVGGTSPNYPNISAAVNALNTSGVNGTVIFNIRSGTYNEHFTVDTISGTSSTNTITFQSEDGSADSVTISYMGANGDNYIFNIKGGDYITLKNLTFKTLNTTYARIFTLSNNTDNITLDGCVLNGSTTSATQQDQTIFYSENSSSTLINDSLKITNCTFNGGSYAIYCKGDYSNTAKGTVIENNQLLNHYYYGIYLQYHDAPSIQGNTITTNSTYTYGYRAIYLTNCPNALKIIKNNISTVTGNYGIYMNSCTGTSTNKGLVANNFISIGGSYSSPYGIQNNSSSYQDFYFNSINMTGNTTSGSAFYDYSYSGTTINIKNNSFANFGGGRAIYIGYTSSISSSDYNNLYTNGTSLGYWGGAVADLAAWKTASSKDASSISVNPLYISFSDLHSSWSHLMDGKGTPITGITDDIDGDTRNTTTPDIGADEFDLKTYDAAVLTIDEPATDFVCAGNKSVKVTLLNNGTTTLTSATINWSVNGTLQSVFSWTGSLASTKTTSVTIGNYTFGGDTFRIKTWSSNPNGNADAFTTNDSASLTRIFNSMTGDYTIGGTSPNYATFTDAVNDLYSEGVCGAVTFKVRTNTYTEQISIPQIRGSSSSNTITFQSETGKAEDVTLTFGSTDYNKNYVVELNGTDYITFKNITFTSTSTSYPKVFNIINDADNVTITDCILNGYATTSSSQNYAVIYAQYSGSTNNDNMNITNNTINNGSYGIYHYGTSSASGYTQGTVIEKNTIKNAYYAGLYLFYHIAPSVKENNITTNSSYSNYFGMYLYYLQNKTRIIKNKVFTDYGRYGIYIYSCNGSTTERGLIANNFIYMGGTNSPYGIYLESSSYQDVYYNSVNMTGNTTSGNAYYNGWGWSNTINVMNNIFSNTGGGRAIYISSTQAVGTCNYNNLYATGTNLGNWGGSTNDYTNLSAWITATVKDSNSVSVNPYFYSSTDLHTASSQLNGAANPVSDVTDDIDGETRNSTTPDIGADEIGTATDDAVIVSIDKPSKDFVCAGSNDIYVTLFNNSSNTLSSVTVNWSVNGTTQTPYSWTGTIASGKSDSIKIGTYAFTADTFLIQAWSSKPNGNTDSNPKNDSTKTTRIFTSMSGSYTIGGTSPDYSTFVDAVNDLTTKGLCGAVVFNVRAGTYTEQISISQLVGGSSTNSVVFQSETGKASDVILTYAPTTSIDNYVVQLDGGDYIIFKNMTFTTTSTNYSKVFNIVNDVDNVTITGCILNGYATTSSSQNYAVIYAQYSGSTNNDNLSIINNTINDGSYGIYHYGTSSASGYTQGTVIEKNIIKNAYYTGLYLFYHNAPSVKENTITSNTNYSNYYGMYLYYCQNKMKIVNNKIATDYGRYGIYLYYSSGSTTNRGLLANNFIYMGGTNSPYGISNYGSNYIDIYYNSINMTGTSTTSHAFHQDYGYSNTNNVMNNIFSNTGGGYAYYVSNTNAIGNSDYNDLYVIGTYIGYWGGNATDLNAWITASGKDSNSVSIDPAFASSSDLHLCNASLNGKAKAISEVTDDVDGAVRDTVTPDIGADEFSTTFTVNLGNDTTSCGTLTLDAGNPGATFLWSNGETTQTITVDSSATYSVLVTSACGVDSDNVNVTVITGLSITKTPTNASCFGSKDGSATLTVTTGTPPYTYAWDASTGSQTTSNATDLEKGIYAVTVTDKNGCSSIESIDITEPTALSATMATTDDKTSVSGCDGTATADVQGGTASYTYQWGANANNQTSATATGLCKNTYTVTVTDANACTTSASGVVDNVVGIKGHNAVQPVISIYPNPSEGEFILEIEGNTNRQLEVHISDILGKVVYSEVITSTSFSKKIMLQLATKGIYQLHIVSDNMILNKKIIIQ